MNPERLNVQGHIAAQWQLFLFQQLYISSSTVDLFDVKDSPIPLNKNIVGNEGKWGFISFSKWKKGL